MVGEAECLALVNVVGLVRPQVPVESPLPTSIQRCNNALLIEASIPAFEHSHDLLELCLLLLRQRAKLESHKLEHFRHVFKSKDVSQVVHDFIHVLDGKLDPTCNLFLEHLIDTKLSRMAVNRGTIVVDGVIASLPAIS